MRSGRLETVSTAVAAMSDDGSLKERRNKWAIYMHREQRSAMRWRFNRRRPWRRQDGPRRLSNASTKPRIGQAHDVSIITRSLQEDTYTDSNRHSLPQSAHVERALFYANLLTFFSEAFGRFHERFRGEDPRSPVHPQRALGSDIFEDSNTVLRRAMNRGHERSREVCTAEDG